MWEHHSTQLRHEKQFDNKYRMSYESFGVLSKLLERQLWLKPVKAYNSVGHSIVPPEIIVANTICWLSGGSQHDIRDTGNYSKPSFFRLMWCCIDAIISCPALSIDLPTKKEDLLRLQAGFKDISTDGVIMGCVGAINGFLLLIKTPSQNESANVRSYFSGHYQAMGLNVQAMCDSKCRFTYVGIKAPGRSSDVNAYRKTALMKWVENLPPWVFAIGDIASVCSEHLLTLFCGSQRLFPDHDNYNFFLSQVRFCFSKSVNTSMK